MKIIHRSSSSALSLLLLVFLGVSTTTTTVEGSKSMKTKAPGSKTKAPGGSGSSKTKAPKQSKAPKTKKLFRSSSALRSRRRIIKAVVQSGLQQFCESCDPPNCSNFKRDESFIQFFENLSSSSSKSKKSSSTVTTAEPGFVVVNRSLGGEFSNRNANDVAKLCGSYNLAGVIVDPDTDTGGLCFKSPTLGTNSDENKKIIEIKAPGGQFKLNELLSVRSRFYGTNTRNNAALNNNWFWIRINLFNKNDATCNGQRQCGIIIRSQDMSNTLEEWISFGVSDRDDKGITSIASTECGAKCPLAITELTDNGPISINQLQDKLNELEMMDGANNDWVTGTRDVNVPKELSEHQFALRMNQNVDGCFDWLEYETTTTSPYIQRIDFVDSSEV